MPLSYHKHIYNSSKSRF